MKTLWVEKYRPQTIEDYVWVDLEMRAVVEQWLQDGALPHVLFSGAAGTGKTSLCKLLLKRLDIPSADILYINASRERQVDAFQAKIVNFVDAWAMGASGIKYIILDECDRMGPTTQSLLRAELETYSDVCRFLGTCNYPARIIPALHSRMQELRFPSLNKDDFTMRLADILIAEAVQFEPEVLLTYVEATYPDLRKTINTAQQNSRHGVLQPIHKEEKGTQDYLTVMLDLFASGQFLEARKLIVAQIQPEEYDDFFRKLYENLSLFGKTQDQQDEALIVIRNGLLNHAVMADPEINLAATLVELSRLSK